MRSLEIPQPQERDWRYRALEILPGGLTWTILSLPIILGALSPKIAAYFIIAYLLLWFVRAIGLNIRALQGYRTVQQHRKASWGALNKDLDALAVTHLKPNWHSRNVRRVAQNIPESLRIKPSEVYHAVFVAFWNESRDILTPTIQSIIDCNYDKKKMILILAYEQRGGPEIEALAKSLIKDFGHHFFYAEAVMHPWPMVGEIIGKGGNINFAGRRFKEYLTEEGIDPLRVMVTTLDADNRPDKEYFGALTYTYCSTENPKHASYQPVTMYTNNIWDAPAPMRVIATGNSIWNMVLSLRPHMLRNFSAHSQPMAALIDTDFWSARTIVEDGHQYWRTYFRYDGDYEVYPVFVPIYQDAVLLETYKKTLTAQFKQIQRWAWGASDVAYVFNQGFLKPNNIPKLKVLPKFFRLLESHISWSTAPLILILAAYPLFLFHTSSDYFGYLANELPQIASGLQRVAMVGILVTLFVSMLSLPPKPERYKRHRTVWMVVQWIYLPITSIIYSSFAAINAQTRLMFGWYLGWVITLKAVKKDEDFSSAKKGVLRRIVAKLGDLTSLKRRRRAD